MMKYFLKDLLLEEASAETPSVPSGDISLEQATDLIKKTNGKFFTVVFVKKDGTPRVMNARLGVKVHLRGGELGYDAEAKGLLPVFDVKTGEYRVINLKTITSLKIGKNTYTVK